MVLWDISMELRLRELAEEGVEGADIASRLSAEFGVVVTSNAVFHKASRLGIALRGRSPKSYDLNARENPFGPPAWLQKELAKEQEQPHERPKKVVCLGWEEDPDEITPEMEAQKIEEGYFEAWNEYVDSIVRNQKCTSLEAEKARTRIPDWFREWCEVILVLAWDLGSVSGESLKKYDKAVEEAVGEESQGKSEAQLEEDLANLEALNKVVGEAQKREAIRKALKEGASHE